MISLSDVRRRLASPIGRIGAGLLALGALLVLLWPSTTWSLDIDKVVAFAAAIGVWLWSEIDAAGEPHPNDVALFKKIMDSISHAERRDLAEQDMGDVFPRSAFRGSREVVKMWNGPTFEFQDQELNNKRKEARHSLDSFIQKVICYTFTLPDAYDILTVKTHVDLSSGSRSPRTLQKAQEMNEAAELAASPDYASRLAGVA